MLVRLGLVTRFDGDGFGRDIGEGLVQCLDRDDLRVTFMDLVEQLFGVLL